MGSHWGVKKGLSSKCLVDLWNLVGVGCHVHWLKESTKLKNMWLQKILISFIIDGSIDFAHFSKLFVYIIITSVWRIFKS